MVSYISNAISAGSTAVATGQTVAQSAMPSINSNVLPSPDLDNLNTCLNIDIQKEITDVIKQWLGPTKKNQFSKLIDENSRIGKIIKAFKAIYNAIMKFVNTVGEYIAIAYNKIQQMIEWVNEKVQLMLNALNNPCIRAARQAVAVVAV